MPARSPINEDDAAEMSALDMENAERFAPEATLVRHQAAFNSIQQRRTWAARPHAIVAAPQVAAPAGQERAWAWIMANRATNEFAASLYGAVRRFGRLTERQEAAARRNADRAEGVQTVSRHTALDVVGLDQAFGRARASGLRRPRLVIAGFEFSLAPETGRNPGAIYVKVRGVYVGKIMAGLFTPGRDFSPEMEQQLRAIAADPRAASEAHGRETGVCSCCNATLTDPVSIARGIGPICAGRWGF